MPLPNAEGALASPTVAVSAGDVVRTAFLNYNQATVGNFVGSVWDWEVGQGAVDPSTGDVWIPTIPAVGWGVVSRDYAPTIIFNPQTNSSQLDLGLSNSTAIAFDATDQRVFAAQPDNNSIAVLNLTTGAWSGASVSVGDGPAAIAFDPLNDEIYVANAGSNNISVFHASNGSVVGRGIPVGADPTALALDLSDSLLYVADYGSSNLTVVNTATNSLQFSVPLRYGPVALSWAAGPDLIAVAMPQSPYLQILSGATGFTASLPIVGEGADSVSTNGTGSEFITANDSGTNLTLVNSTSPTGSIISKSLEAWVQPSRLIEAPPYADIFVWSNQSRQLSEVNLTENRSTEVSPTLGDRPGGVAYDPDSNQLLTIDLTTDTVSFLNASSFVTSRAPLALPGIPDSIVEDSSLRTTFVGFVGGVEELLPETGAVLQSDDSLPGNNSDLEVAGSSGVIWDTNSILGLIALRAITLTPLVLTGIDVGPASADGVAYDNQTNRLFAVDLANSSIAVFNGTTGGLEAYWHTVPPAEGSLAFDPADNLLYAANQSVYAISPSTGSIVAGPIDIGDPALVSSISYDPSRHFLYVADSGPESASHGNISVIDGSSLNASLGSVTTIAVGQLPLWAEPVALGGSTVAGSGEIWVTNEISGTVSVIASAPEVTYLTASPDPVDASSTTQILLGLAGGAGPSTVSYSGLPPSCPSADSLVLNCRPGTNGTYNITATMVDSLGYVATASAVLSVNPSIHLRLHLASKDSKLDVGETFTASVTASGGTTPYEFSWAFGDGSTAVGSSASHSYLVPGTFIVAVTATDQGNGVSSASATVVVAPLPTVEISTPYGNVTDVNVPVQLYGVITGGTGPGNASWKLGDGTTLYGLNVSHSYAKVGVYFANLTYTDATGTAASDFVTIRVNPALKTSEKIGSANAALAVGSANWFNASISGGTGPYSAEWTFGDGSFANGSDVEHSFANAGSYSVILTVRDSVGAVSVVRAQVVIASAASSGLLHGDALAALFLGLVAGLVLGVIVLFVASRRTRPKPPTPYTPPPSSSAASSPVPTSEVSVTRSEWKED
ncbi:MAG TPA: PKD domain-containing protein [Thermoplasmata archaeon]|nr:PKD domain-containing protein [Thermoplasmata archaeon]